MPWIRRLEYGHGLLKINPIELWNVDSEGTVFRKHISMIQLTQWPPLLLSINVMIVTIYERFAHSFTVTICQKLSRYLWSSCRPCFCYNHRPDDWPYPIHRCSGILSVCLVYGHLLKIEFDLLRKKWWRVALALSLPLMCNVQCNFQVTENILILHALLFFERQTCEHQQGIVTIEAIYNVVYYFSKYCINLQNSCYVSVLVMCECVCYCAYFINVNKLYVHVCVCFGEC